MLVKQEQLSPCEVELRIEVEAEKVSSMVDDTYAELGKATTVPGFRKGKAPRAILANYLDLEKVKDRVADKLVRTAYSEALEESKLEPYAPADVELVKLELDQPEPSEMIFTAKVPLPPKVELGQYTGLEVERKVPTVEDADVDAEMKKLLDRHAEFAQITDRGTQNGDTAVVEMKDDTKPEEEMKRNVVQVGDNLPEFDKGILGMKIDEEKVIDIVYADDHADEELRGKTVPIRVKLIEIHEKKLPELTDEWVKATFHREPAEGEEPEADPVDTAEKLRVRIKSAMEKASVDVAEEEVRGKLVEMVVKGSTINFPEVMVDEAVQERVDHLFEDLKKRKVTLDQYLDYVGQTSEQLREQYSADSRQILTTSLVFREIMDKEGIKLEDADVDEEIARMAAEQGVPPETMRAYADKTGDILTVRNRVLRKKLVDFIVQASNIKNVGA